MKVETKLNGVAVDKLMETIELLKARPELAEFKFRTRNTWVDGTLNRAENPAFYGAGAEDASRATPHRVDIDEPPCSWARTAAPTPSSTCSTGSRDA